MNNIWKIRTIIRTQGNSIVLRSHLGEVVWAIFMDIIKQLQRSPVLSSVNTNPHSGFYPVGVTSWNWLLGYSQFYRIDYRMTVVKNAISNFLLSRSTTRQSRLFPDYHMVWFQLVCKLCQKKYYYNWKSGKFSKEQHKKVLIEGHQ